MQPIPYLIPVFLKVFLSLHIAIDEGIIGNFRKMGISSANIASVGHIMDGISHIEPVFLLVVDGIVLHLFSGYLFSHINIHEVHTLIGMKNIAYLPGINKSILHALLLGQTSYCQVKEKLVPKAISFYKFSSYHIFKSGLPQNREPLLQAFSYIS